MSGNSQLYLGPFFESLTLLGTGIHDDAVLIDVGGAVDDLRSEVCPFEGILCLLCGLADHFRHEDDQGTVILCLLPIGLIIIHRSGFLLLCPVLCRIACRRPAVQSDQYDDDSDHNDRNHGEDLDDPVKAALILRDLFIFKHVCGVPVCCRILVVPGIDSVSGSLRAVSGLDLSRRGGTAFSSRSCRGRNRLKSLCRL